MALRILKIHKGKKSKYLIWSTVVDAPLWPAFKTRKEVKLFLLWWWGQLPSDIDKWLDRCNRRGCSHKLWTFDEVIAYNRAGKHGKHLTLKQLIKAWW